MTPSPLFSVIIPTHNRAQLLKSAIESVVDQTFEDWELIVVDDGSKDETKQVVSIYSDTRIKYVYQENKKLSAARNRGVFEATGKYYCFLDDDDYYLNDHLQHFYSYLSTHHFPKVILRTCYYIKSGEKLRRGPFYEVEKHKNPVNFAAYNFCASVSLCIPRICFAHDKFLPGAEPWEDTHFMLRIFAKFPFHQLNTCTYVYVKYAGMGSILMYTGSKTKEIAEQNISAMRNLFTNYGMLVNPFLPKNTLAYLISEKYSQHAFNSVLFGKFRLGIAFLLKALHEDKYFMQWRNYLKLLIVFPIKWLTGFPKKVVGDQ